MSGRPSRDAAGPSDVPDGERGCGRAEDKGYFGGWVVHSERAVRQRDGDVVYPPEARCAHTNNIVDINGDGTAYNTVSGVQTAPGSGTWTASITVNPGDVLHVVAVDGSGNYVDMTPPPPAITLNAGNNTVALPAVKLARDVSTGDLKHLAWLKEKLGDRVLDQVIITTGLSAYRRKNGIVVVPFALLGP